MGPSVKAFWRVGLDISFFASRILGNLMMLPTDIALIAEPAFRKWVEIYAKDEDKFFKVRLHLSCLY